MRRALATALLCAACVSPLERGERLYREGDRLGALETWRAVPEQDADHARVRARIAQVEDEFRQLVVRNKKRAGYLEAHGRMAEAILAYRLALVLQPDDAESLAHVQQLARALVAQRAEHHAAFRAAFERGELGVARHHVETLRRLDPFDAAAETDEWQLRAALREELERLLVEGRAALASGDQAGARDAFRRALELDPDDESARGYLSYVAVEETPVSGPASDGGAPAAFDASARFASEAQIRAEGFYQNALAAERAGDPYAAIRFDLRALNADAGHAGALRQLAELRRRLAGEVDVLIESGRRFFREEDLSSALDQWRRAQLIDPDNERARAYAARAEQQIENLERLRAEPDVASDAD
jgi:tetratricopeptide (TPR) repeat protein